MVPLPKAVAVAAMADTRIVMVGDFRQLPAVTATTAQKLDDPQERALYRDWYERDVFDAAGVVPRGTHGPEPGTPSRTEGWIHLLAGATP